MPTAAAAVAASLLVALSAAAPGAHGAPLDGLLAACEARTSTDGKRPVRHRVCTARVPSFDGTPLDATLTLPARRPRGRRLPLLVFLHGLLSDKGEYLSLSRAGTGPDRTGESAYKTIRWNNVWFAGRGYAVLNYSARGHGASGGQIHLASRRVEVRDTHHLTGLLADDARVGIDPRRVAVLGSSYGGGQAWLLLATRGERVSQYGTWRSAAGRVVRLAALVPQYTWTDLLDALVPNGRQRTDRLVDPATAHRPLGVGKQTLLNGFLLTSQGKLPPDAVRWLTRLNAGEPYDAPNDPVVPEARRALTVERSAYYQDDFFAALRAGRTRRVPVLAGQGWTDPIFAPLEAVRMYRRLRAASPGYPIGLYLGDFEHLTALVKLRDLGTLHDRGTRLLDRVLRGRGPRFAFDVRSARTSCDRARFGPVVRVRDWDGLARRRAGFALPGTRTTASPAADARGPASDPVPLSLQRGRGCITTRSAPAPGVAAWTLDPGGLTLAGAPLLRFRFRTAAPDITLNARLWDVAPDGTRTLVTRAAYRAVSPDPAGEVAEYELWGNHWRFAAGHRLELEVVQDDSSFLRRDSFPSTATIDEARLVLPAR